MWRVFEGFAEPGSGTRLVQVLRAEGVTTKRGRLMGKGEVYKLLHSRTYLGEVVHKGKIYPGEHEASSRGILGPRARHPAREPTGAGQHQPRQSPALLRGLIFGVDGRAMSPTHTRRRGRLYRYYVSQSVLKADGAEPGRRSCGGYPPPRSRARWWTSCGRSCASPRWSWAPGARHGPQHRT